MPAVLAVEPDLWFLDEPFSALDPLIRREMQEEFLRIQRQLKKTIVFITHDFDEAIRLADRIAIMKDGAVVQVATPEELVLAPANDYVAAFTAHVTRAKVVTLGRIAAAGRARGRGRNPARRARGSRTVADQIVTADRPFAVERDGEVIGHVTPAGGDRDPDRQARHDGSGAASGRRWPALALALATLATVPDGWLWPPGAVHLPLRGWLTAAMKWLTDSCRHRPGQLSRT